MGEKKRGVGARGEEVKEGIEEREGPGGG